MQFWHACSFVTCFVLPIQNSFSEMFEFNVGKYLLLSTIKCDCSLGLQELHCCSNTTSTWVLHTQSPYACVSCLCCPPSSCYLTWIILTSTVFYFCPRVGSWPTWCGRYLFLITYCPCKSTISPSHWGSHESIIPHSSFSFAVWTVIWSDSASKSDSET